METNRLKQFCTIVETGSLSRAADLLGITHGGLHKSLRVLEDDLGFALTVGKGRGIEITERGREFYPKALEVLRTVERAFQKGPGPESREYKIGSLEIFLKLLPEKILATPMFSNRPISFQEMSPGNIEIAVQKRILDIGITYIPMPTEGVEYLRIGKFKMGIFCAEANLANKPLSEVPFVVPSTTLTSNPMDILNTDGWRDGLFLRTICYRASSLATAIDIVKAGKAAIFMPIFLKNSFGATLHAIENPTGSDTRDVFLVVPSNKVEAKEEKVLGKVLRQILQLE
jgi:DNA-binding transcriptional LysR family regulator